MSDRLDVWAAAGGRYVALDRTFVVEVSDRDARHLVHAQRGDIPIINAILVTEMPPPDPDPLALICGGPATTSPGLRVSDRHRSGVVGLPMRREGARHRRTRLHSSRMRGRAQGAAEHRNERTRRCVSGGSAGGNAAIGREGATVGSDHHGPGHAVGLVAGQVADIGLRPRVANVTVVRRRTGRDRDCSVGRASWTGSVPRPMPVVDRSVTDDPLVVDRVGVPEHERHRPAGRDAHERTVEVRVVDVDRDLERVLRAGHRVGRDRAEDGEPGPSPSPTAVRRQAHGQAYQPAGRPAEGRARHDGSIPTPTDARRTRAPGGAD